MNILIVEDETLIAMGLRLELQKAGYGHSKTVVTGEEAVEIAAAEQPDVVLMDIRLAGDMDGIEAAGQIQKHAEIPVIFMTSYHEPEIQERAQALNPLGYLYKPVRMHLLSSLLERIGKDSPHVE